MKRLIYLLILCCFPLAGMSATTDSLLQMVQRLPHDSTRLEMIQKIVRTEQNNAKCIQLSEQLFKEAIGQKNSHYAGIALYFQIIYYYNRNELDSVSKRLITFEPYARKANLWDYYFDGVRCKIDLYSYREQFELAINQSTEMSENAKAMNNIRGQIAAYQCLSNAYLGTGRTKEAQQTLKEAHKLLPQLQNIVVRNSVLAQLIALSHEVCDYADLIVYLQEQKKLLANYIADNPDMKEAFNDPVLFNNIYYAYYYTGMKQAEPTLKYLTEGANHLTSDTYAMYKVLYIDAYAEYYRLLKEYDKALAYIDSTINQMKDISCTNYIQQLEKKADILAEAGRKEEALPVYSLVLYTKDSLENDVSNKQMQLIQEDYHIDRLQLEKEQLRNKVQLLALTAIVLALIVLSFFMVRMFHLRKALKQSEQQTREATQVAQEANEMKNRFLSNMSYNIRIPLNGVVGFSQLIAMDEEMDEKTRKEYAIIIQRNSEELMRLVNDVLDLSRLEANMMKFQIQTYDVLALCNDVLYMARERGEGQINIESQSHIETEQLIAADTARLTQALLSALAYLQPQEAKRTIRFTLDADATSARFSISNSPLADPAFLSQEVSIRHDINRLLLEHFGGSYVVAPDAPEGPTIVFTYPLSVSK